MDDASIDPRVGSVLQERYRILERLAVGSMGIVYRAERLPTLFFAGRELRDS